jgi:hypothetical protein
MTPDPLACCESFFPPLIIALLSGSGLRAMMYGGIVCRRAKSHFAICLRCEILDGSVPAQEGVHHKPGSCHENGKLWYTFTPHLPKSLRASAKVHCRLLPIIARHGEETR